ncbi:MAG: hypothetical protein Q8N17_19535 [Burkholderiaceae bacterium]|nr:hypothetical protein [Burkholderiaceae bacterium]
MMKPIPSTASLPPSKTTAAPVRGSDAFQAHLEGLRKLGPLAPQIADMEIEQAIFGGPDLRDRSTADIQNLLKTLGDKLTQGQFAEAEVSKLERGLTRYAQKLEAVLHDHPHADLDNSRAVHTQLLAMTDDCRKALEPPAPKVHPQPTADGMQPDVNKTAKGRLDGPDSPRGDIKPQSSFDDAELFNHSMVEWNPSEAGSPHAHDQKGAPIEFESLPSMREEHPAPADQQSKRPERSPSDLQSFGDFQERAALNTERPVDTERTWAVKNDARPPFDPAHKQHGRYASMSMPNTQRPSPEAQKQRDILCEREADAVLRQAENRFASIDSKKIALLLTGMGQAKRQRIIHGLGIIAETNNAKGLGRVVQELNDMNRAGLIRTPRSGVSPRFA